MEPRKGEDLYRVWPYCRPWAWQGHIDHLDILWAVPAPLFERTSTARALSWHRSCSQLPMVWLPAVGTPQHQSRPGRGNRLAIGPAAMVAWCGGTNRSHSKGDGPNIALTHIQPGIPGRFLGGNALSGFLSILPGQNGPQRSIPITFWGLKREIGEEEMACCGKAAGHFPMMLCYTNLYRVSSR